jgi:hypothetical protein
MDLAERHKSDAPACTITAVSVVTGLNNRLAFVFETAIHIKFL